jgi:hypothetical protein
VTSVKFLYTLQFSFELTVAVPETTVATAFTFEDHQAPELESPPLK